jgi:AcrR family transcriptional regulator
MRACSSSDGTTMDDTPPSDRKSTQRERLLRAMRALASCEGYAETTIAKVIADAGVSRPTFYEYFADKEDCFLAVLGDIQGEAIAAIRQAVQGEDPERAAGAAMRALVEFAGREPAKAKVLVSEVLAAGPRALDAREEGLAEIARIVEDPYRRLPPTACAPDLSTRMLIGGSCRLLATRLRRGETELGGLLEDLQGWVDSYAQPLGEHRWRALEPVAPAAPSPFLTPLLAPAPLPPGRPRLAKEQVAENHRQRILFAAAQISEEKGYAATTIADVTRRAGLDGRAFHSLFAEKSELFTAVHELHFQRVMAVSASAFFTTEGWPERVWEAGRAFASCIEESSTLAQVSFIESYAGGPITLERVEEVVGAFQIFLQEGYQHVPENMTPPSRLALEAITATIFEIVYHQTRQSAKPNIAGLLPHVTHLALAPFLGPSEANAFIDGKTAAGSQG